MGWIVRLLIAGVPRAGKTTLSNLLHPPAHSAKLVLHTDDFMHLGWSQVSAFIATKFDIRGPWIVEGVAVVRAARKWLATHHSGTPCDEVRWLGTPRVPLSNGQATMAKACETVWDEVRPELERRGVRIVGG
jgi:adenylate kinase family enzyme